MGPLAVFSALTTAILEEVAAPVVRRWLGLRRCLAFPPAFAFSAIVGGAARGTPAAGRPFHFVEYSQGHLGVFETALFGCFVARSDVRGMDTAVVEPANSRVFISSPRDGVGFL